MARRPAPEVRMASTARAGLIVNGLLNKKEAAHSLCALLSEKTKSLMTIVFRSVPCKLNMCIGDLPGPNWARHVVTAWWAALRESHFILRLCGSLRF